MINKIKFSEILETWKTVFSKKRHLILVAVIAVGFYLFNVFLFSFKTLIAIYPLFGISKTLQFFAISALGFKSVIMAHSYIGLIITSILLGILGSLVIYKLRMGLQTAKTASGLLGWMGAVFALIAPGCAACGIGLVSLLGISGAFISFLPYEGLELTLLSIFILIIATLSLSRNMYQCSRSTLR